MPTALPLLTMAYVLGIWLGDTWRFGPLIGRALLGLGGAGLLAALLLRRCRGLSLLGMALCLGTLAQADRPPPPDSAPLLAQAQELNGPASGAPEPVLCTGTVVAAPVPTGPGPGMLVRVAVSRIGAADPGAPAYEVSPPALVAVVVRGPLATPLLPDDQVLLRMRLRPPGGFRNPGAADGLRRALAEGTLALGASDAMALVRWDQAAPARPSLLRHVALLRERLDGALRQRLLPPGTRDPTRYALVAALGLGLRGALAQADAVRQELHFPLLDRSFRDAGIYHVLSVSGFHLAVATFLFYSGLGLLLRHVPPLCRRFAVRRLAALLSLPATVGYTLLTGAEVATVRAAGVAVLWLLAVAMGRRARLAEALAGAALWILHPLGSPLSLFDPALQLSLAAALATAYLRPFGRVLAERADGPGDAIERVAAWALRLLEASLAAILGTAPLCALYFAQFQAGGLLGNLLAAPLGELVVVPVGLSGALLSILSPGLGGALLSVAGWAALAMAELAAQVADLGLSFSVPAPGPLALALWVLGLCCLGLHVRAWPLPCAAGLVIYLLGWWLPPGELRVTFLDVGQGDAAVIELPRGGVVVIDAGGLGGADQPETFDTGDRIVAPFLRRRGHRRIDLLVASHPHPDHVAGLAALLEQFPVSELWTAERGRTARPREPLDPSFTRALQVAAQKGVPLGVPRPLDLGGAHIEPLFPCAAAPGPCAVAPLPGLGHNDNSLVLRLSYAGRSVLFPGDLELPGELALLDRHDQGIDVRADLLKAPHHCSRTSSSDSFVSEVAPLAAVCSVGRQNRYGFPHREVVARYERRRTRLFRTDRDGAVQAIVTPAGDLRLLTTSGD